MKRRMLIPVLIAVAMVVAAAGPVAAKGLGRDDGPGTVEVALSAPADVPVNVTLVGQEPFAPGNHFVAVKGNDVRSTMVALDVPSGQYQVMAADMTYDGVHYIADSSRRNLVVHAGDTVQLDVRYVADHGASDLYATAVEQNLIRLSWTAPDGTTFALRRTAGTVPATSRHDGVAVPTTGSTAIDRGLEAGHRYTYALFSRPPRSRWIGPVVAVAGTVAPNGSTQASFIALPTTLLASQDDVRSAVPTGSGVRVVLADGVATPLLGTAVVLPVSASIPGGFLGVVTSVGIDGRMIALRAGSLSDAFDYYALDVPDLSATSASAAESPTGNVAAQVAVAKAAAPKALGCAVGPDADVSFQPDVSLGGHFRTKLDSHRFLGADIPTGASVDTTLSVTVQGAASIEADGQVACAAVLPKVYRTITFSPVPISVLLQPKATLGTTAAVKVSNVGLKVTGGVSVAGTMSVTKGASFTGDVSLHAVALTPKVSTNGGVSLRVGGQLAVGPGVGTPKAGVIVAIGGELNVIDATFRPHYPIGDSRFNKCVVGAAAFTRSLQLTAKAWLSKWHLEQNVSVDALSGSTDYPGSPWFLPSGCDKLPGSEPKDSLLGDGVDKVGETTVGSSEQWGHVTGFAPGKKTWVLSTGRIDDATGSPESFASTNLGGVGDDDLSAFAGYPTFDAASYKVTLVPSGDELHVKYVFASEEYPEFVGSQYNDVMAVYVDGKNCAKVPGSSAAVAVNSINDHTHAQYYVDNSQGAAGYSTSMDGLTVPLTCSVPVEPGQAVTVKIAVADTSDHIYDSAVALIDGGIWSD